MFALLGDVIHEVPREAVESTTCPIKYTQIRTGWIPEYEDIAMADGTIDYAKVIECMTGDAERMQLAADAINAIPDGCPAIVLANRVQYLTDLSEKYTKRSVCISGAGQSKAAKEKRKQSLAMLNAGEIDCIFATYHLAKEGLDVPNLRYVVFATPEKDETTVIQAAGRVGRKSDGKDVGRVIDFVDDFGMYLGWAKKRVGFYKKINATEE